MKKIKKVIPAIPTVKEKVITQYEDSKGNIYNTKKQCEKAEKYYEEESIFFKNFEEVYHFDFPGAFPTRITKFNIKGEIELVKEFVEKAFAKKINSPGIYYKVASLNSYDRYYGGEYDDFYYTEDEFKDFIIFD